MTIQWCKDRKKWIVFNRDVSNAEWDCIYESRYMPDWYDSWDEGDVYYYEKNYPLGELHDALQYDGFTLNIKWRLERMSQ